MYVVSAAVVENLSVLKFAKPRKYSEIKNEVCMPEQVALLPRTGDAPHFARHRILEFFKIATFPHGVLCCINDITCNVLNIYCVINLFIS